MNNSDYLTETEKFLLGYIEHIPSEYPPYDEEWDEEELEAIEELNEIFNLQEVETMKKYNRFGMTGNRFRKIFKPMRNHKMPRCIRTKLYWFLYDEVFNCYK